MKTIIFLGSYSGGGASTAIELFREMGIPCVSTHELLYAVAEGIDELIEPISQDLLDGSIRYTVSREFRKNLAEDVIKKSLGRSTFAISAANKLKPRLEESDLVVMECFDQWDYLIGLSELKSRADTFVCANIVSPEQDESVDEQKLLDPLRGSQLHTIQNPMTREGLKAELQKVLLSIDNNLNTL